MADPERGAARFYGKARAGSGVRLRLALRICRTARRRAGYGGRPVKADAGSGAGTAQRAAGYISAAGH